MIGPGVGYLVIDELGRFIGNITMRGAGGWQREIVDYIIKSFSCANSWLQGRQAKDDKVNPCITIAQPHFCCLGSTVKERLKAACSSAEVIDGFLNRWIVFDVEGRPARNDGAVFAPPPPELLKAVSDYAGRPIRYTPYGEPEPREVSFTPEAWDAFLAYKDKMEELVATSSYPLDKLYSRAAEHVEKLSLVLCDDEDILVRDVRAAICTWLPGRRG